MATLRKRSSGWSLLAWNAGLVYLLLALSESLIAQQPLSGGFTNIDPPGAVVAAAWGINNAGVKPPDVDKGQQQRCYEE